MAFTIIIEPSALEELENIRVFDRRRIEQAINEQLTHEPTAKTRNRKMLAGVQSAPSDEPPLWELRVGDFRVFYYVVEDVVFVWAVRTKPPPQTTEQVL